MLLAGSSAMCQGGLAKPPSPAFHWRCETGDAVINHNPAWQIQDSCGARQDAGVTGVATMAFDSLPYARDYTVIVVYKPESGAETPLWQMQFDGNSTRGLTTERIMSDSISIRYAERTGTTPAINSLRQSAPDSTAPFVRLSVGGGGAAKVAEVHYYTERLGNAALRKVQSSLAIRYGVTLGPVSYIDGAGHRIWDYADSGLYHHRVTGIGIDTLTGLRQLRSRSEMDGSVLTISADSLGEGSFLVTGDNDAPLVFGLEGGVETMARRWKIQSTGAEGRLFTLVFDKREMETSGDSLVLLVDGYGDGTADSRVFLPDNAGGDSAVFTGVEFPTDSSTFTLGRGGVFWLLAQGADSRRAGGNTAGNGGMQGSFSTSVYPNPTSGHYAIDVERARQVQVTVYNVQGSVVATFAAEGRNRYHFEGDLPTGSVYYATVSTENGSQTMKLVVK